MSLRPTPGEDRERPLRRAAATVVLVSVVALASLPGSPCTNLLVAAGASADGGTVLTYSCDGGIFAGVRIEPSQTYASETESIIRGAPGFFASDAPTPRVLGRIPQVESTYRYIDVLGGPGGTHIGGMNANGLCIAETTLAGTRPELSNPRAMLAPFSVWPERALMSLALQRARTAREAVQIIGTLAETYGYGSSFPIEGEQLAISDGTEVWTLEIFGPGPDWRPGSGEPGAVWCAQRVPDGHIGISANRSRIHTIDLCRPDEFLASPNVVSLAESMGWWSAGSGRPFDWAEAYAPSDCPPCSIREWRAFDLAAPSLELAPDDPIPFSVRPDHPLELRDIMDIQRDVLRGTAYDVTADPVFRMDDGISPLASPMADPAFYELLGLDPERTISSRRSSFSCLYQSRPEQPFGLNGCAWFAFGPAATSCYVPIYSGVTELPSDWGWPKIADADLSLPFWSMILPGYLASARWAQALEDIRSVRDPAESTFLDEQGRLAALLAAWETEGEDVSTRLNAYTAARLDAVHAAYQQLTSYLLVCYVAQLGGQTNVALPTIAVPRLP